MGMENTRQRDFTEFPALEALRPRDVGEISRRLANMDPWLTLGYTQEAFSHYLLRSDPALSRYCVIVSDKLSGVLAVRFPWLFGPFVELLALFEGSRGRGFGRVLIDRVGTMYPTSKNIWATVSTFNLEAQKFYARLGFESVTVLRDLIQPGRDEILLQKRF